MTRREKREIALIMLPIAFSNLTTLATTVFAFQKAWIGAGIELVFTGVFIAIAIRQIHLSLHHLVYFAVKDFIESEVASREKTGQQLSSKKGKLKKS